MTHPLIDVDALRKRLAEVPPPVLLDCRFDLSDPQAGQRAYAEGHLPGALHADLALDMSGTLHDAGATFRGRHPLPSRTEFAATAARWGITPGRWVIAYDAHDGLFAARAWWLLRWIGHSKVAVLDGGLQAWLAAGGTLSTDGWLNEAAPAYPLELPPAMPVIDADTLLAQLGRWQVVDARAPERYRGEVEPLDAVAGHIPGAVNRFYRNNLGPDGRFKPAAALKAEFQALLAGRSADEVVHQCGSGVTACHNLLAMALAGMEGGRLYPGSWSEWVSDPRRPVAQG
jgi:thiosulfate/3-mercaptopyruvate sulfurtransferase